MTAIFPEAKGKAWRGIYAAAISPLTSDGGLDGAKLVAYCRHMMSDAGGCDGVAPLGTTGESTSLPMRDRLAAPGILAEAGLPSDRVIIGTGAPSVADAIDLTRAAVEAGYTNALVLPPYYFKSPSDEGQRLPESSSSDPRFVMSPRGATILAEIGRDLRWQSDTSEMDP